MYYLIIIHWRHLIIINNQAMQLSIATIIIQRVYLTHLAVMEKDCWMHQMSISIMIMRMIIITIPNKFSSAPLYWRFKVRWTILSTSTKHHSSYMMILWIYSTITYHLLILMFMPSWRTGNHSFYQWIHCNIRNLRPRNKEVRLHDGTQVRIPVFDTKAQSWI